MRLSDFLTPIYMSACTALATWSATAYPHSLTYAALAFVLSLHVYSIGIYVKGFEVGSPK